MPADIALRHLRTTEEAGNGALGIRVIQGTPPSDAVLIVRRREDGTPGRRGS
jgi:hypothetical protein